MALCRRLGKSRLARSKISSCTCNNAFILAKALPLNKEGDLMKIFVALLLLALAFGLVFAATPTPKPCAHPNEDPLNGCAEKVCHTNADCGPLTYADGFTCYTVSCDNIFGQACGSLLSCSCDEDTAKTCDSFLSTCTWVGSPAVATCSGGTFAAVTPPPAVVAQVTTVPPYHGAVPSSSDSPTVFVGAILVVALAIAGFAAMKGDLKQSFEHPAVEKLPSFFTTSVSVYLANKAVGFAVAPLAWPWTKESYKLNITKLLVKCYEHVLSCACSWRFA